MKTNCFAAVTAFGIALAGSVTACLADMVQYTISFTETPSVGTLALPSGTFLYDSSTATFSDFFVSAGGFSFDLTPTANNPATSTLPSGFDPGGLTGAALTFAFLNSGAARWTFIDIDLFGRQTAFLLGGPAPSTGFTSIVFGYYTDSSPTIAEIHLTGDLSISPAAVPAPGAATSVALGLMLVGFVGLGRKCRRGMSPIVHPTGPTSL